MKLFKGEFEISYGSLKERNNYAWIWKDISQLNIQVFLIPHISSSLNINNGNAKTPFGPYKYKIEYQQRKRKHLFAPINTKLNINNENTKTLFGPYKQKKYAS